MMADEPVDMGAMETTETMEATDTTDNMVTGTSAMTGDMEAPEADELMLDETAADGEGDELLLDAGSMLEEDDGGESFVDEDLANGPETAAPGNRSWITGEEIPAEEAPKPAREGGTLFERMSNIARGAAKAQVDEEPAAPSRTRDPLDIPRFLGRQNNQ
jgi:cell division protein FtsZ